MIDFELLRAARSSRAAAVPPSPEKHYHFAPEVAAAELDYFLDKYQITDPHDMAVIMATVLNLDPNFYNDL